MGIAKLPLNDLEAENPKEIELRLLPSLDMLKIKDKKDRGTITIKVTFSSNVVKSVPSIEMMFFFPHTVVV